MNLLRITVGELLDEIAFKYPDNEAIVDIHKGIRLTYKELLNKIEQLARGFLRIGLKKGDHVALWSPNRWEWIVTQFGAVLSLKFLN